MSLSPPPKYAEKPIVIEVPHFVAKRVAEEVENGSKCEVKLRKEIASASRSELKLEATRAETFFDLHKTIEIQKLLQFYTCL